MDTTIPPVDQDYDEDIPQDEEPEPRTYTEDEVVSMLADCERDVLAFLAERSPRRPRSLRRRSRRGPGRHRDPRRSLLRPVRP